MKFIKKLFGNLQKDVQPQALRIDGIAEAPLTPAPDDAELAAQAVLEMMCDGRGKMEDGRGSHQPSAIEYQPSALSPQTSEYYHQLANRIRLARQTSRLHTTRFVAYCERTLQRPDLPEDGPDSLSLLEKELYKRIDTVEREGGELKRRWQHCLAEVTVRRMNKFSDGYAMMVKDMTNYAKE